MPELGPFPLWLVESTGRCNSTLCRPVQARLWQALKQVCFIGDINKGCHFWGSQGPYLGENISWGSPWVSVGRAESVSSWDASVSFIHAQGEASPGAGAELVGCDWRGGPVLHAPGAEWFGGTLLGAVCTSPDPLRVDRVHLQGSLCLGQPAHSPAMLRVSKPWGFCSQHAHFLSARPHHPDSSLSQASGSRCSGLGELSPDGERT